MRLSLWSGTWGVAVAGELVLHVPFMKGLRFRDSVRVPHQRSGAALSRAADSSVHARTELSHCGATRRGKEYSDSVGDFRYSGGARREAACSLKRMDCRWKFYGLEVCMSFSAAHRHHPWCRQLEPGSVRRVEVRLPTYSAVFECESVAKPGSFSSAVETLIDDVMSREVIEPPDSD